VALQIDGGKDPAAFSEVSIGYSQRRVPLFESGFNGLMGEMEKQGPLFGREFCGFAALGR
jgi:hypothetical protein